MALILSQEDVREALSMKDAIEAVEEAFRQLALGSVEMPLRPALRVREHRGMALIMPAYVGGMGVLGLKLVSVYPENPSRYGKPTILGTVLLCDARSGSLLAIMDGTYLTAMRTGAASGVATKYLARKDAQRVGIVGSGVQARTQLMAIYEVRRISEAKVYSPNREHREDFSKKMGESLGIKVEAVNTARECVEDAEIISTATTSKEPVFEGSWVKQGAHINGIGSHSPDSRELDEALIKRAKVVVDSIEAALKEAGDLIVPLQKGIIQKEHIYAELGEVLIGKKQGRVGHDEITVFKSQGLAVQDVATAHKVYEQALKGGIGKGVEF